MPQPLGQGCISCPSLSSGRRGSRTLKAHRSPDFESGAVALRLALPSSIESTGGWNRTSGLLINSEAHEPAHATPVRVVQSGWPDLNRRSPGPEPGGFPGFPAPRSFQRSAQRESNPHIRHGEAVSCRYIMGTIDEAGLSEKQRASSGTRTHVAALRVRSPRRWTIDASPRPTGTRGARTLTTRVRAGHAAANISVPALVNIRTSRPGRS